MGLFDEKQVPRFEVTKYQPLYRFNHGNKNGYSREDKNKLMLQRLRKLDKLFNSSANEKAKIFTHYEQVASMVADLLYLGENLNLHTTRENINDSEKREKFVGEILESLNRYVGKEVEISYGEESEKAA